MYGTLVSYVFMPNKCHITLETPVKHFTVVWKWGSSEIFVSSPNSSMCLSVLSHSVMFNSLWPHGLQPARLLCPWGFSRQEYWSGLPCPPPGDLPNPGTEPWTPTLRADSLLSELPRKSKNPEGVAYPFSRGFSQPRKWTRVSCFAGGFFTSWATREAQTAVCCS